MSAYQLGKLLYEVSRKRDLAHAFQADPAPFLERYDLSEEEKQAVLRRDIRFLYEAGVHPLLLLTVARLFGIQQSDYTAALAGARAR